MGALVSVRAAILLAQAVTHHFVQLNERAIELTVHVDFGFFCEAERFELHQCRPVPN